MARGLGGVFGWRLAWVLLACFTVLAPGQATAWWYDDPALPIPAPGGMAYFLQAWVPNGLNSQEFLGRMTFEPDGRITTRDYVTVTERPYLPKGRYKVLAEGERFVLLFYWLRYDCCGFECRDDCESETLYEFAQLAIVDEGKPFRYSGPVMRRRTCGPSRATTEAEKAEYMRKHGTDHAPVSTQRMGQEEFDLSEEELLELFRRDRQCGPNGHHPSDDGDWSIGPGTPIRFQSEIPHPKFHETR